MADIVKPHDKFFKETFGDIDTAKDFMKNYLPQEIVKSIDIENLLVEKDSFIEKELEESFSDLLFKTTIRETETYLYLLFEHKSYPDKRAALQLLKYMVKIWEQKVNKEKSEKLPVILPMLVYHGKNTWKSGFTLSDLIESLDTLPQTINKYIPNYEYILYDLSEFSNEVIKGSAQVQIGIKLLRDILKEDTEGFLKSLKEAILAVEEIEEQEKGIEYFETCIRYIMSARSDLDIDTVFTVAKQISHERSEIIMTIAEKLREEGMQKGIEKGIEKGKIETAKAALKEGMTTELVAKITGLDIHAIDQLKKEIAH